MELRNTLAAAVCALAALVSHSAQATTVDILSPLVGTGPLDTFFTGQGYTVNDLSASFTASDIAGANFVILSGLSSISAAQLSAADSYVNGGGHLLLNSDGQGFETQQGVVNSILASLGSSIHNVDGAFDAGFHDTHSIIANPLTAGVSDVNYAYTSSLTGGTPLVNGVSGQLFIAAQNIGSGLVSVIADVNTQVNINSTATNNNSVLYCNLGGLSCGSSQVPTPEPASLAVLGFGLVGLGVVRPRRASK